MYNKQEAAFTRNRWRGCRFFLLTFIRVPSFTKTWYKKVNRNFASHDTWRASAVINVVVKPRPAGDSQLNDCVKGNTGVVHGRQGGLAINRQKQCCYQSHTLPGCSRSRWPRTLYSMLTRRSKFSWDTNREEKQWISTTRNPKQCSSFVSYHLDQAGTSDIVLFTMIQTAQRCHNLTWGSLTTVLLATNESLQPCKWLVKS